MNKYFIGVDLGGTKINTVLMNEKAGIIRKIKLPTQAKRGKKFVIKKILESIKFVSYHLNKKSIFGVGIGVPGTLNKERTKILRLPNLQGWKNINLKRILEKKTGLKVIMENDSNCMALAEFLFGHGKRKKINSLVCITLGTGLGGGIIINGKIYNGKGNAAEFGHMTIESFDKGIKCNCGNKGCLEEYVSVRGIQRIAGNLRIKEKNIIRIQEMARKGNKKAMQVYEITGKYLGIGLSNIVKILHPEIIVIGGGISKSGSLLLKPAIREMKKRIFFKPGKVKTIKLKDNSGAIGAASLLFKN